MRACGVWVVGSNLPFPYVRIIPHNRTEENQKKKKKKENYKMGNRYGRSK